jgi:YidC/Oxa1 family membrane protein insertase
MQENALNYKFWIALIFSIVILIGWDIFFLQDKREAQLTSQKEKSQQVANQPVENLTNIVQNNNNLSSEKGLINKNLRVKIENQVINGSINLIGGAIDDVVLLKYKDSVDANSDNVKLLHMKHSQNAYFFQSGWLSNTLIVPNDNSIWQIDGANKNLTDKNPVVLSWKSPSNSSIVFKKTISIDESYLITIVDEVINNGNADVDVASYALIIRHNDPKVEDLFISHEGFVGYVNETLERVDYSDTLDEEYNYTTKTGYIGFTDKYWLSALILQGDTKSNVKFNSFKDALGINNYQVYDSKEVVKLRAKSSTSNTTKLFVGPKEYSVINKYNQSLNLSKFDDTLDFGWFFFFTKPMIKFLLWINSLLGSFGLAILVFTVIIRIVILPIAYKSYISMAKLKELQPKMKQLKELYSGDTQRYNKELMDLYKKEQVNPLSGCLPILLQIPIFFSIYKVIFISIELRHTPFWGWIKDLSYMDTTNIFNLFGLIPWEAPSFLHIGVWPILMGVTMYFQQKMNTSQSLDPMQQKIMNFMPIFLTILLASFPVGLVIYWTWSNVLSIGQQYLINVKVHKDSLKNKKSYK